MSRPEAHFDWQELMAATAPPDQALATRERLRMMLAIVVFATAAVFLRAVQLEFVDGARSRAVAARPITRSRLVRADRGRILARDGSVLACDAHTTALAMHYRWFEQPADKAWLRLHALRRLSRKERRDPDRVRSEQEDVLRERDELQRRLTQLCGLSADEWQNRCEQVQRRIDALALRVNERRRERFLLAIEQSEGVREQASWLDGVGTALAELFAPEAPVAPAPVVLAEQEDYHPLVENVSSDVAEEINAHAEEYRGVRIVEIAGRDYPAGRLAAHAVGHLGPANARETDSKLVTPAEPSEAAGRMGIERQYETMLRGTAGLDVERLDHRGRSLGAERQRMPEAGKDVVLSLDPAIERSAEALLDDSCRRQKPDSQAGPIGGAAVVIDVQTGELLALASAPRFDPRLFAQGESERLTALFAAPDHPLVDRATKMAIPPGSVFKTLTAIALVEERACDPDEEFFCQGYLHDPSHQRCLIFRQQGVGHGELTLAAALARSCNVYFFDRAGELGCERLTAWATRFGFGRPTGIDLADEAAGNLPHGDANQPPVKRLGAAQALAIGQGELSATPLQVARMMAAVANGGRLLRPRLTLGVVPHGASIDAGSAAMNAAASEYESIDVSEDTLRAVRAGLCRAVADPEGTAYMSARLQSVAIAGKTGTAQTAGADHAWFAGYAPAEAPRVAFAVVLEHGGQASGAARIARELIARIERLGYFDAADDRHLAGE